MQRQERALLVWTLPTWKRRVLMELPAKSGTKPMHSAIMALGAVSSPPCQQHQAV